MPTPAFIARSLGPVLESASRQFPAIVLTGPRQSGKTTLLREHFGNRCAYVSLEPPDVRAVAAADPRGFLDAHEPPVILDEIQFAPGLLPYIKERIDARRGETGRYFLTGSQNLLLLDRVTESLAGRAAMLRLLPLSGREVRGRCGASLPWEDGWTAGPAWAPEELWRRLVRGGYPELVARPDLDGGLWHSSYAQTYLERDVRMIRQIGDLSQFQIFLRTLAARSGTLLNLAALSRDLGIALNTAKAWLSVLEATFQVVVLRPYHANVGKRLVKTPKAFFTDTGTLCHLAGLRDPGHAAAGPLGGPLFESAVLGEIFRTLVHRGEEPRLYFWRTSTGEEVDFLVETEEGLIPVEAKATGTPRPAMAAGIDSLRRLLGDRVGPAFLVHAGDVTGPLARGTTAVPFASL